jgi:hypothetical protein
LPEQLNGQVLFRRGFMKKIIAADCLHEHFDEEAIPKTPDWRARTDASSPRQATIQKARKKLAKEPNGWFVLCYQLDGSSEWHMAWSEQPPPMQEKET